MSGVREVVLEQPRPGSRGMGSRRRDQERRFDDRWKQRAEKAESSLAAALSREESLRKELKDCKGELSETSSKVRSLDLEIQKNERDLDEKDTELEKVKKELAEAKKELDEHAERKKRRKEERADKRDAAGKPKRHN